MGLAAVLGPRIIHGHSSALRMWLGKTQGELQVTVDYAPSFVLPACAVRAV